MPSLFDIVFHLLFSIVIGVFAAYATSSVLLVSEFLVRIADSRAIETPTPKQVLDAGCGAIGLIAGLLFFSLLWS